MDLSWRRRVARWTSTPNDRNSINAMRKNLSAVEDPGGGVINTLDLRNYSRTSIVQPHIKRVNLSVRKVQPDVQEKTSRGVASGRDRVNVDPRDILRLSMNNVRWGGNERQEREED